jgi:hypothetical protein
VGGRSAAACWKDVRVGIEGRPGKRRRPWAVWLLAVVTCGVYGLVWYYKANRELRDCGAGIGVRPVLAVLALLPGVVLWYVPLFTSIYRTGERIRRAQAHAGLEPSCGPGRGLLLVFALGLWPVYYQAQLNKAWIASAPAAEGGPDELETAADDGAADGLEAAADESASDELGLAADDSAADELEPTPDESASDELEPAADEGASGEREPAASEDLPDETVPAAEPEPDGAAAAQRADSAG